MYWFLIKKKKKPTRNQKHEYVKVNTKQWTRIPNLSRNSLYKIWHIKDFKTRCSMYNGEIQCQWFVDFSNQLQCQWQNSITKKRLEEQDSVYRHANRSGLWTGSDFCGYKSPVLQTFTQRLGLSNSFMALAARVLFCKFWFLLQSRDNKAGNGRVVSLQSCILPRYDS